jgi:hypothetical protein
MITTVFKDERSCGFVCEYYDCPLYDRHMASKYVMHDNALSKFPEISTYIKYKSIESSKYSDLLEFHYQMVSVYIAENSFTLSLHTRVYTEQITYVQCCLACLTTEYGPTFFRLLNSMQYGLHSLWSPLVRSSAP